MPLVYDKISTRDAFGNALLKMAEKYDNIYAIAADTTKSMGYSPLENKFPDKVVNVGIAEQNMALVAAGAATCGAKSIIATYAPFASMRILEQIRTFIAYPNLDVKIISGLGGLSGGIEGVTHQGLEDVSIMRSIPNMIVVIPADASSTEVIAEKIISHKGPVYLRIGRGPVPKVFDDNYSFEIGKANIIKEDGKDASIICNGVAVARVLQAQKFLEIEGYSVRIIEMPCVKPIDEDIIIKAAKETNLIITVEENSIIGGLGSAVCEVVCEKHPTKVVRIGLDDAYAESGPHDELLDKYNLSVNNIAMIIMHSIISSKDSF